MNITMRTAAAAIGIGTAMAGFAVPVQAHAATTYKTVTVRPGDTLNRIARANRSTVTEISKANGITNPNYIWVGQQIKVPVIISKVKITGIIDTSFGAHYDISKCSVSSPYWNGNRRFYLNTSTQYGCFVSPVFKGAHPIMLSFGKTAAPWYGTNGSHHGIDIDMPVGTPLYAKESGRIIVRPSTLGSAYGVNRMIVRTSKYDYVYGHMSSLSIQNGQTVSAGQLIGYSGMSGVETEDGPHLHFEVRPAGGGLSSAYNPWTYLGAHRI